ncbi:MAG TPA: hypothetical protein DCS04_05845, partial [Ruminococcaceae bacterium]|nr:hypothetical protein [Oscillospiraceae bacterium]
MKKKQNGSDMTALKWIIKTSKGSWLFVFVYAVLSAALAYFGINTAYGVKDVVNGAAGRDFELLKHGALYLL